MSKIFLSHSSKDNVAAQAMADWLSENGFAEFFLDLDPDRGINPGERWEKALHQAANRCEAVIFLISKNWLASDWCDREFALARNLNKNLFSVIIDHTLTLADLKPQFREAWQVVNLADGQDGETREAELPGTAVSGHVTWSRTGLRRLKNGLEKSGLDAKYFPWPPEGEPDRAPYRGLLALEEKDAAILFGREADIVLGVDRLRRMRERAPPRILTLLGASGAGKSSYLRAGLLARLRRDDMNFLPLAAIRPGRDAIFGEDGFLGALVQAFPKRPRAELRAALGNGAQSLKALFVELAEAEQRESAAAMSPTILVAIDQGEDLFRAEGARESEELLALVRALVESDDPSCIALFAIRSDSFDRLEHASELLGLAQEAQPLLPMPRGNFRSVIEGPAERAANAGQKLAIDPQLTARLLADIDQEAGADALPLLAFTLQQLYEDHRASGRLTLADYAAFGAMGGAIDRAVERAFRKADADPAHFPADRGERERLLRRGLIPWLAGIDPDTRSPRRSIARTSDIPAEARALVALLVEERLLVADRRAEESGGFVETLEPAHEALLRKWGLLKGWLEEDLGELATLEALRRAVRDWDANARGEDWLAHQGERLADARGLDARSDLAAQLDARDRLYLAACSAKEDAGRAQRAKARADERARLEAEALAAEAKAEAAQAQNRGARRLALAAAIAALALASLGGWAWSQKLAADRQAERANRAVHDAAEAVNTVVFQVALKVRDQVGMPISVMKALLDPILALEDKLSAAGEVDPILLRSHFIALDQAVQTLLAAGDTTGAKTAAERSLSIARELAKDKANAQAQRDVSVSLETIGDVKRQLGDSAGALAVYEESLAIRRELAKDKANAQAQRDVSVSLETIGDVKRQLGDSAGALAAYEESLAIQRELAKDRANAQAQRDVALSLERVGDAKLQSGASALAAYEESLAIRRELAKDKANAQAQRDVSVSLNKIGEVRLQSGDSAGALAAYEESLAIRRELAKDKANALAQRDVAVSLEIIGQVKWESGDRAGALADYQEGLAIQRELAKDKANAQAQRDLSVSLGRIGDVELQTGNSAGALAAYEEDLAIQRELAKDNASAQAQRDLSVSLDQIGAVRLQSGDSASALAAYQESLAIARELAKDKANAQAQRDLSVSLERIGDVKLQTGDRAGALAAYEEDLAIRRALANDKANVQGQRDVSVSLRKIGDVKLQTGDRAGALAAYEEDLAIARELAKDKANAQAQTNLVVSLAKCAQAGGEARARLTEALAILKALDAAGRLTADKKGWIAFVEGMLAKVDPP